MKLTFVVTPEVSIQGGEVWCEGFVVGEIIESRVVDRDEPYAQVTLRIDNKDVHDALRRGLCATLEATIAELRSEPPKQWRVGHSDDCPNRDTDKRPLAVGCPPTCGWIEIPLDREPPDPNAPGPAVPPGWCGMEKGGVWTCGACPDPAACQKSTTCQRAQASDFQQG